MNMNTPRRVIWTAYLAIWIYLLFVGDSSELEYNIMYYFSFGWIPFLLLHYLWRGVSPEKAKSTSLDDLKKYKRMKDEGLLSDKEYQEIKKDILKI